MSARDTVFAALPDGDRQERAAQLQSLRDRLRSISAPGEGDTVELFERNALLSGSAVHRLDATQAAAWILSHVGVRQRIALATHPLLDALGIGAALHSIAPAVTVFDLPSRSAFNAALFDSADIGITVADAGIADSGAILSAISSEENRSVSLLPDEHIVFLPAEQVLPSLHAAVDTLNKLITHRSASALTLIGGPSKTADIEKVLVTGVHGPGALTIVLINTGY
jgi:L-lactate utilization protein LutC